MIVIFSTLILQLCLQNLSANFVFPVPEDNQARDDDVPALTARNATHGNNRSQPLFAAPFPRPAECTRSKTCAHISSNITDYLRSIDVNLPYTETVQTLNDEETLEFLRLSFRLKYHKKCWESIQPLIFAFAVPKCVDGQKRLIPISECRAAHDNCGPWVINQLPEEISELKCEDQKDITDRQTCQTHTQWFSRLQSNISFVCPNPMVPTVDTIKVNWEVDFPNGNCALRCQNAFFSEAQQLSLHVYIAVLVCLGFLFNGSALISLAIRWRTLTKYPDKCLFFINICFLAAGIGWAIQFIPGARTMITCSEDGTERIHEPRHGESYGLCLFTFLLVYYFMLAAAIWFVNMTYCWYSSFRTIYSNEIKAGGTLKNYSPRFHIAAWITPSLLCAIVIATSGIDGNNLSGICFIGIEWGYTRGFLLVMPLLFVAVVSGFFVVRGLIVLYRLKKMKEGVLSDDDQQNIRSTMWHIGFIAGLVVICIFVSVAIHAHYYLNFSYYRALRIEFIDCHLKKIISGEGECHQQGMLDYETIELGVHLGLQFIAGIIFSSWVWRRNQWKTRIKDLKNRVTQRISTASAPLNSQPSVTIGADNAAFVPDIPSRQVSSVASVEIAIPPPQTPTSTISFQAEYDAVDGTLSVDTPRSRHASDVPGTPDEAIEPEDNRLENWQERAREARLEKRKKSSTVRQPVIQQRPIEFLHSVSVPDSTVVVVDPNPSSNLGRKRRPGRAEFFKQGRSKAASDHALLGLDTSDTGSSTTEFVEMNDMSANSSLSNINVSQPKKGILKNFNPIAEDNGIRDSPDEGIDVERTETGSRESMFSLGSGSDDDRVQLHDAADASEV